MAVGSRRFICSWDSGELCGARIEVKIRLNVQTVFRDKNPRHCREVIVVEESPHSGDSLNMFEREIRARTVSEMKQGGPRI